MTKRSEANKRLSDSIKRTDNVMCAHCEGVGGFGRMYDDSLEEGCRPCKGTGLELCHTCEEQPMLASIRPDCQECWNALDALIQNGVASA